MEQKILKKLEEIDDKLVGQSRRFDAHDSRFDELDHQFNVIDRKLAEHTEQLDFLALKVLEHDKRFDVLTAKIIEHDGRFDRIEERMEGLVTKQDHQQVMNVLDGIVKYMKKKDEETTMLGYGLRRIEEKVEQNTKDIQTLKLG